MITINVYLLLKIIAAVFVIGYFAIGIGLLCFNRVWKDGLKHVILFPLIWPFYMLVFLVIMRSK